MQKISFLLNKLFPNHSSATAISILAFLCIALITIKLLLGQISSYGDAISSYEIRTTLIFIGAFVSIAAGIFVFGKKKQ